jgi:protein TonB
VDVPFDEPTIPPRLRRPLAALWISVGVHAAVIALVQVAPPAAMPGDEPVIEARLVSRQSKPPAVAVPPLAPEVDILVEPPKEVPVLAPSVSAEAIPVAKPVTPPPAQPEPPAFPSRPAEPTTATAPPEPAEAPPAVRTPAPLATMTSSVDLTYYSARDVDVHPRALREIVPEYPYAADRQRQSGKVRLQLKLEADGRVSDIDVVSATPPGQFEESALKAFRDVRFVPAQKNGRPVRAMVLIEVVYDWEGHRR